MKKRDLQNILVPVDFSPMSERAIETAQWFAQRSGAAVHLVHVHEYFYPAGFMVPGAPIPGSMITFCQDDADRVRKQLGELATSHGIPITNCYVGNDIPIFNGVCQVAKQIEADLIVLQARGHTGITRFFEGSHAERIVQHSPCPVLVARNLTRKAGRTGSGTKVTQSIDAILVPVDFSRASFEALEYAIEFADRVAARLIVFHAVHLNLAFSADGYAMCDLSVLIDGARKNAEKQMQEFVRLAKFRGVKFETAVQVASPASEICDFAEERDVDLIITATHGRTGLSHLLMGNVAEQVVRHARQPVLVVPSHPEIRTTRLIPVTRADQQFTTRAARKRPAAPATGRLTKRSRSLLEHPFPERRKTNKFRESHSR
jgi:nucleotide-binding universal stress UspA family protein